MTLKEAEKLKIGDTVIVKRTKKILKITNMWYQSHTLKVFRLSDGRMYDNEEISVRQPSYLSRLGKE